MTFFLSNLILICYNYKSFLNKSFLDANFPTNTKDGYFLYCFSSLYILENRRLKIHKRAFLFMDFHHCKTP